MEPPSTGESKPYHCSVCGDDFKRHEHLIRHSRRHTQEKPFKCDVCQKEFARRDILSRHAIVHVPAAERANLPQKAQKRGTKRVQQACNNCAKGKCRCDGETPCSTCQSKGLENCEYTLTSTPAKRRRADSSASTAAANVLLQVASSAHASPKGDWTMDYNGHHGDVSMQPPGPIVFGYTPTLNGTLPNDPFMYGASRSASRYGSRAPSPSHEFDAQFENPLPAASVFGFLFKDSAKDLPGINAILPRLLPVPGFGQDFAQSTYGHNGVEQAGTYSNYRNDYMATTSNPTYTRPASPVLSFQEVDIPETFADLEESPIVEPFTENDRKHLQDYTQTQLPSARLMNIIVQLYFEKFHESLPIIHRANYSPGQSEHVLTLAILSLGSRYMQASLEDVHRPFLHLARRVLKLEPDNFATLQAQFLLDVAELYSIQSQGALEAVEERRASLLRKARAKKLFEEDYGDNPENNASIEARWQILRRAEERRRLSWAIWIYDHLFNVFFGVRCLMEVDEVRSSLPWHENLWEQTSAQEWADQFAPDPLPIRTRTLWSTGRLEDRGVTEVGEYGTFCRTILAHVEARRVQDIANAVPASEPATEGDAQQALKRNAEVVLTKAKSVSELTFSVLDEVLRSEAGLQWAPSEASLNLYFTRMITHADLRAIRQLLFGDDRAARAWAQHSQKETRAAAFSAAHIMRLISDRQPSPFAGMIAFYATMVLYCFAKFSPSNESMTQCQLDKQDFSAPLTKQWIEKGSLIPIVHGIGLLDHSNISRITASWQKVDTGIAYWGVESLRARIESLTPQE